MKKLSQFLSVAACAGLLLTACSSNDEQVSQVTPAGADDHASTQSADVIPGEYIVRFYDEKLEVPASLRSRIANFNTGRRKSGEELRSGRDAIQGGLKKVFDAALAADGIEQVSYDQIYAFATTGFAAKLSADQVSKLERDARVASIEPNRRVKLSYTVESLDGPAARAQTTPYGISRVGGAVNYAGGARWAWIIDSGIDLDHPDLTVNTTNSRSFISGLNADDGNGHGTHVAGTVAARNNTIGVVGVAAGATVVSVRVFDASGSSANSIIIAGIDYVRSAALAGDVANMSLGGGASSTTDNAVLNLAAAGVRCAIAAGNSSANANNFSPARVNGTNIWTVSSHDSRDRFSTFSNFANPPIDWCAPGTSVYSTYRGGGYATLSGTSMATPHVAGILLVNNGLIYSRGTVTGDRDGSPDRLARRF